MGEARTEEDGGGRDDLEKKNESGSNDLGVKRERYEPRTARPTHASI